MKCTILTGLISFLLGTSLLAQAEPDSLKQYYFPYQDCFEKKFYKYVDQFDPNRIVYLELETQLINNDTVLIKTFYDARFDYLERLQEIISDSGAYLDKYTTYYYGPAIEGELLNRNYYTWSPNSQAGWSAKVRYRSRNYLFQKERQLNHYQGSYQFKRQEYATVRFVDEYKYTFQNGFERSIKQVSAYAPSIGLVSYKRLFKDGTKRYYLLRAIMTEAEWQVIKRQHRPDSPVDGERT